MTQMLLLPDPRPLVERLGTNFFRTAPDVPGVYLMRDRADTVLYVGKAKNLRKRLASYRVANPDRLRGRHLRLLRAVERIEVLTCASESAALAKESSLLRSLRPRFNRAGTWPGTSRFLAWRMTDQTLDLALLSGLDAGWSTSGPLGHAVHGLRSALARLVWCMLHPDAGCSGLPLGCFEPDRRTIINISHQGASRDVVEALPRRLEELFAGQVEQFAQWIMACTSHWNHHFNRTVRDADLEVLSQFSQGEEACHPP